MALYQQDKSGRITRAKDANMLTGRGSDGQRVDAGSAAEEDAQNRIDKAAIQQLNRMPDETQEQYEARTLKAQRAKMTGAEIMERDALLTMQKLRENAALPLIAEVTELVTVGNIPKALITFNSRRIAPATANDTYLPMRHFYQDCEEFDASLTILPDELNGFRGAKYLKHINPTAGIRGRLLWALDNHPLGWAVPENWIFIVDASLTAEQVTGATKQAAPNSTGVVSGVTDNGGFVAVTVDFNCGGSTIVNMPYRDAPKKGTRGVVTRVEGEAHFTPDAADSEKPSDGTY